MPALEKANEALGSLTKASITELRAFKNPPVDVINVVSALMILLGKEPSWASAKKEMTDPKFIDRIIKLDKNNMPESTMKKLKTFTKQENFLP